MRFDHWPDECTFSDSCDCDQVEAQLAALRASGKWKTFRKSTVTCSRCGDVLAEIVGASPESVIVTRAPVTPSEHPHADGPESIKTVYLHRPRASKGRKWWVRVSFGGEVDLMCRCRVETLPVSQVVGAVDGKRKVTL